MFFLFFSLSLSLSLSLFPFFFLFLLVRQRDGVFFLKKNWEEGFDKDESL